MSDNPNQQQLEELKAIIKELTPAIITSPNDARDRANLIAAVLYEWAKVERTDEAWASAMKQLISIHAKAVMRSRVMALFEASRMADEL